MIPELLLIWDIPRYVYLVLRVRHCRMVKHREIIEEDGALGT